MKSSTLCKGRTHQCVVKLLYVPLYNPMCRCLDLGSVTMLVYPVLPLATLAVPSQVQARRPVKNRFLLSNGHD
jgi:hypothetical protein